MELVTDVQLDSDAAADSRCAAGELDDRANDDCDAGAVSRLGKVDVTGESVDDISGQTRSIRREQCRMLFAFEIVANDEVPLRIGEDQIDADALEIAREQ